MEAIVENSLVQASFGELSTAHGSPVGLYTVPDFDNLDDFKKFCTSLAKLRSFPAFVVGDAFLKAVEKFGDKKAMSDTICGIADYNPNYIRRCADVCGLLPYERRVVGLSFEHHDAVHKLKGDGCLAHQGAPKPLSAPDCRDCEEARLACISDWLDKAAKKKWTAKELKEEIGAAKTTTVREHQRNLDGKEFDVEVYKEAVNDLKTNLSVVKESLAFGGLLTKTDAIDRGKNKSLLGKFDDLEESMGNLRKIIEANLA